MSTLQLSDTNTPLGANCVPHGGVTFRTWAPKAKEVYIAVTHDGKANLSPDEVKTPENRLYRDEQGYWGGYIPDVHAGDYYRFYIVGEGSEGFKRDPYARELEFDDYQSCDCIIYNPNEYQWHDANFQPPAFHQLIVYQFHIGVFFAEDEHGHDIRTNRVSKILDAVDKIEYWVDLGINAIMPLPFQEFRTPTSLGYNGTDLFSPEMDYCVRDNHLGNYLEKINRLFTAKGYPELSLHQISHQCNQFKVFIDLCHLYGIAVITDVVYNHAGTGLDDESLKFFDRQSYDSDNNSLYFTNQKHVGPIFAYWKQEVRQFLIDNAKSLIEEYHVDGLRYDQVTVIAEHGGWQFAQDLTNTIRFIKPSAIQIAEYWGNPADRWKGVAQPPYGMGFDSGYSDVLRDSLRKIIAESTGGKNAHIHLDELKDALYFTHRNPGRYSVFQCIENHDLIDDNHTGQDRQPRIAELADPTNPRSWYARSRAKVATGLLLTAPGIPMIFMGQEFLENKHWSDAVQRPGLFIWWEGLEGKDKAMSDQHRFTRDLMWLRRQYPALCSDCINVYHVHNDNRIIAFHRWLPDSGKDVVIIASLNETTFYDHSYQIGFPKEGHWYEVFNSDIYDNWFNPNAQGNYNGINANGPARDGLPASGQITIPANSILVFSQC